MVNYDELLEAAGTKVAACADSDALKAVEREYVGKEGVVARMLASIPTLPAEERPQAGKTANQLKGAVL
ncbi:MAG: phenylalanyl-tRNA synthetase alpha chain, partial [Planctomycetota bacterium]